jgi:hypothetical protein
MSLLSDLDFWIKKMKAIQNTKWRINERLYLFEFLTKLLQTLTTHPNDMVCLNANGNINLLDTFKEIEPLGSTGNLYSDNYKLSMKLSDEVQVKVAVKVIPIDHKERLHMYDTRYTIWRELKSLEMVTDLVKKRVMPHLPLLYGHYICNSCEYKNPQIINKQYKMCILLLNELSDTDLRTWIIDFSKKKTSTIDKTKTWRNIFFQIWIVMFTVQHFYQMIHHDLHWGNLLVDYVQPGGYRIYIIDSIKYYVPNVGILLKLWDFGKCFSVTHFRYHLEEIEYQNYSSLHRKDISFGADISKIHNINRWIQDISEISNKNVMSEDTEKMLFKIKKGKNNTPGLLVQQYMRKYMHNRIGSKVQSNEQQGIQCKDISNLFTGQMIIHDGVYGIVIHLEIFHVRIIKNTESDDPILVKFEELRFLTEDEEPEQKTTDGYEYLKEYLIGTYKV